MSRPSRAPQRRGVDPYRPRTSAAHPHSWPRPPAPGVSSGFVRDGGRRASHARPAGLARLREVINSRLEEISFRTALAVSAAALFLIVTAVATALLVSG